MTKIDFDSIPAAVDLLIVGTGAAGIAAGVQASRDGIDALVIGNGPPGGLLLAAGPLANLCGFPPDMTGPALARQLGQDLDHTGLAVLTAHVADLRVQEGRTETGRFDATCRPLVDTHDHGSPTAIQPDAGQNTVTARAVIVATGTKPMDYDVPGWTETVEADLGHRDVRTLAPDLSGQAILVVGSGDVAADTALLARQRGAKVMLFHRRADMKATSHLQRRLDEQEIARYPRHEVWQLAPLSNGGVVVSYRDDGVPASMVIDQVVVSIGRRPADSLLLTGPDAAPVPGLFLAGDLIAGSDRFVLSALGTGQRAACMARTFIEQTRSSHPT